MKRIIPAWWAWAMAAAVLLFLSGKVSGQIIISNSSDFFSAVASGSTNITFSTSLGITLTNASQTLQITNTNGVTIDGGTNTIVIDGSGATRLFHVHANGRLTLNNIELLNGAASSGGAIFNEGTLVISNGIFGGNTATNLAGASGVDGSNTHSGNGTAAGVGLGAVGGAIFSKGPLSVTYSTFTNNAAQGGNGGNGGNGASEFMFGGNGGDGGNGGGASGGAIYATGPKNFVSTSLFANNTCVCGSGGAGGSPGSGPFPGESGIGGAGGSGGGGALFCGGPLQLSASLLANNGVQGGSTAAAQEMSGGGSRHGGAGGSASGGAIYLSSLASGSDITNCTILGNYCEGGAGGDTLTDSSATAGDGGAAVGGGLASAAASVQIFYCTLATNILIGGTNGISEAGGHNGSIGATAGAEVYSAPGAMKLVGTILSGGARGSSINAAGVRDGGLNMSSDRSGISQPTSMVNRDPLLTANLAVITTNVTVTTNTVGTVVTNATYPTTNFVSPVQTNSLPVTNSTSYPGTNDVYNLVTNILSGTVTYSYDVIIGYTYTNTAPEVVTNTAFTTNYLGGDNGGPTPTLALSNGSPAIGFVPGIPGISFPLTDQRLYYRVSPTTIGAYDPNAVPALVTTNTITYIPIPSISGPNFTNGTYAIGLGQSATFNAVLATNTSGIGFQWQLDSNNLVDNALYSGTTTSNLVLTSITTNAAGVYRVIAGSTIFYTATSSPVSVAVIRLPTVSITAPAANARLTTETVTVNGTVTAASNVTAVNLWMTNLNDGTSTNVQATLVTKTGSWSVTVSPLPGTNVIEAQAEDNGGFRSPIVARAFFRIQPAPLTLSYNKSMGAISGVPKGSLFNIGQTYTLTVAPAKIFWFTNWKVSNASGIFINNSPTLYFTMEEGESITANFTTNLFLDVPGPYNGLFYETNAVTEQTAGMLSGLTVSSSGSYSGKLLLNGATNNLAGSFNTSGYASNCVTRTATAGGPVTVEMYLQWTDGYLNGSVSGTNNGGEWMSTLYAETAGTFSNSAQYTMLFPPSANVVGAVPPGYGYVLMTNHQGNLTLSCSLADGTAFSQAVPVGQFEDAPLYGGLYANGGLFLGWISLSNGAPQALTNITWIKPFTKTGLFTNGFTNQLSVEGSGWSNRATWLTNATLLISNATVDLTYAISISNNTIVKITNGSPTNSLTGTVNPKTGLLQVTFGTGVGKATLTGAGAILQNTTHGGGSFVTKTNAGLVRLQP